MSEWKDLVGKINSAKLGNKYIEDSLKGLVYRYYNDGDKACDSRNDPYGYATKYFNALRDLIDDSEIDDIMYKPRIKYETKLKILIDYVCDAYGEKSMKESINGDCYIYYDDDDNKRLVFCDYVKGITDTSDWFYLDEYIIDAIHIFKNEKQAQKFIDEHLKYFADQDKVVIAEYPQTVSGFFESKKSVRKSIKESRIDKGAVVYAFSCMLNELGFKAIDYSNEENNEKCDDIVYMIMDLLKTMPRL